MAKKCTKPETHVHSGKKKASNAYVLKACHAFLPMNVRGEQRVTRIRTSALGANSNTTVLNGFRISSVESLVTRAQLRWAGYVVRMGSERIPKALMFGELSSGKRTQDGQCKHNKDVLITSLKGYGIDHASFERSYAVALFL